MADFEKLLLEKRDEVTTLLQGVEYLSAERLLNIGVQAWLKTPALRECHVETVVNAIVQCADIGLEPNSPLGHAYLVPFKKTCVLVVGYKGLIHLALMCNGAEDVR